MASRLLRPDDPTLICIHGEQVDDGQGGTAEVMLAVTTDGELRCSCSSFHFPCVHMTNWIKRGDDITPPGQRDWKPINYSFDFDKTLHYEIPMFLGESTWVMLLCKDTYYNMKVVLTPPLIVGQPKQSVSGGSGPVLGFIDERYEARLAIRSLILDWLEPWTARRDHPEMQCRRLQHQVQWNGSPAHDYMQAHNLLIYGLCNSCVHDTRAEVPDI